MQKLLGRGIDQLEMDWGGVLTTELPVEDDVVFLVDGYLELRRFLAAESESHEVYLGDGLLQFRARHEYGQVAIELLHVPHLDRRFAEKYRLLLSREDYAAAWAAVISHLCVASSGSIQA